MVEIKRNLIGHGSKSPTKPFSNGARLAFSIVVNYEDGSEFSHAIGDDCQDTIFDWGARVSLPENHLIWRGNRWQNTAPVSTSGGCLTCSGRPKAST